VSYLLQLFRIILWLINYDDIAINSHLGRHHSLFVTIDYEAPTDFFICSHLFQRDLEFRVGHELPAIRW